jgi:hypothetical protein
MKPASQQSELGGLGVVAGRTIQNRGVPFPIEEPSNLTGADYSSFPSAPASPGPPRRQSSRAA